MVNQCRSGSFARTAAGILLLFGLVLQRESVGFELGGLDLPQLRLGGSRIKTQADAVLTMMSFNVLPDVTTSSLSIHDPSTGSPTLSQTTLGGGFTLSKGPPLYLEGSLGHSQYTPSLRAGDGESQKQIRVDWNSESVTGGIGWDFPLTGDRELAIRPIFDISLGQVRGHSQAFAAAANPGSEGTQGGEVLTGGHMDALGLGGSLMLDYAHYVEAHEIDLELRYTHIALHSFDADSPALRGQSSAENLSLWSRWRAPTGVSALGRPLRYVLELAGSSFFGPQQQALGIDWLGSAGVGLELDSSAWPVYLQRSRIMLRYLFGTHISGYSIGLGVSL